MSFLSYWTVSKHSHVFSPHPSPSHCSPWPCRHSRDFLNNFSHVTHSHSDWAASCPVICTIERGGRIKAQGGTQESFSLLFSGKLELQTALNLERGWHTGKQGSTRRRLNLSKSVQFPSTIASKRTSAFFRQRASKFSGQTNKFNLKWRLQVWGVGWESYLFTDFDIN